MPTSRHRILLGLLACGLGSAVARAQGGLHVAIEPRVTGLPGGAVWGRSTSHSEITWATPDFGVVPPDSVVGTRSVRLARDAMTMLGARVTVAPGGRRWRLVLDGAAGRSRMRSETKERLDLYAAGASVPESWRPFDSRTEGIPLAIVQLGAYMERSVRWRGTAVDVSGGIMAQRLHTRVQRLSAFTFDGPTFTHHRRSFTDPALQLGAAVGPRTGWASGLRLALRSAHVWRDSRIANGYGVTWDAEHLDMRGHDWQWQPEVALGWQLPMFGDNAMAR